MPSAPLARRPRALAAALVAVVALVGANAALPSTAAAATITVSAKAGALAKAVYDAPNGSTLILRGGSHVNSRITTGKSLTIKNYPGETPVITHPTNRPDYLYFRGGPVLVYGITFKMGASASDVR